MDSGSKYSDGTMGALIEELLGQRARTGVQGYIKETRVDSEGHVQHVIHPHSPSKSPSPPLRSPSPPSPPRARIGYGGGRVGLAEREVRALVVVDVQNDFLPGGALGVPDGDEVVGVINGIRSEFDVVVLTQDYHPEGHVSFASSHPGAEPYSVGAGVGKDGEDLHLWPDHCVQGSRGVEFAPDLVMDGCDFVVRKGTDKGIDAFSGFGPDNGPPTPLAEILRGHHVDAVYVVGLALDYCVRATALDAVAEGFENVFLVTDATRPVAPDSGAKALADLLAAGVRMTTSQALCL